MPTLAILGGEPTRTQPYPDWPMFDERDITAISNVIRSGRWGGYPYPGPQTAEFARRFAELQGGGYAIPMANGTVTMEIALRAANIGWGDEVIVPAYTFQATAVAPMAAGAIPVIADIDPETYCLDPKALEATITPRTKAVIPVHLGAEMADMDAILEIAEQHALIVIEDCAHAHGAKWRGKGAGTLGHFGSFSLQSSKILTTGEGGVLLCRTAEMAGKVASLVDCGRPHKAGGGEEESGGDMTKSNYQLGANYRMTELQAALGNVAIERFPEQARQRAEMAAYMDEALSEISGVRVLKRDPRHTARSIYRYIFAIRPEVWGLNNATISAALEAEGIPAWKGYDPMHREMLFQPRLSHLPVPSAFPERFDFTQMRFPNTERASEQEAIWLDENIFRAGQQGVDDVIAALRKIQAESKSLAKAATQYHSG